MANPEHPDVVKQGLAAIRPWRSEHPDEETLDLRAAFPREADLRGADLMGRT